jgi:hypothetical protein
MLCFAAVLIWQRVITDQIGVRLESVTFAVLDGPADVGLPLLDEDGHPILEVLEFDTQPPQAGEMFPR